MDITWLTGFLDLAAEDFDRGIDFWQTATGSASSPMRGHQDEFTTLLPPDGDPYLRVQRIAGGTGGVHLDLHVPVISEAAAHAISCGATLVADLGHRIMASPGGWKFCLVMDGGESTVPPPRPDPASHRVDQICIDVPADLFEREGAFWAELTGWELRRGALDEYAYLVRPAHIPLRLLLQRLGTDDPADVARAHVDVACGEGRDAVTEAHVALGAEVVRREVYWTTLTDPAGHEYCLTRRDPLTGTLG